MCPGSFNVICITLGPFHPVDQFIELVEVLDVAGLCLTSAFVSPQSSELYTKMPAKANRLGNLPGTGARPEPGIFVSYAAF